MKNDNKIIPFLAAAGLILYVAASIEAHQHGRKDISITTQIMLMILLGGLALIMLLPDLSFFRRRKKNDLIIIDLDQDRHPIKIYQVQEKDLILFCMTEFNMDFRIDEWGELKAELTNRLKQENENHAQLEKWCRQGRSSTISGHDLVATLEYEAPDGFHADILPVSRVPDALCASAIVIKANYPNSLIFHSRQELDEWMSKLNHNQWEEYHAKISGFQRKTKRLLTTGQAK